MTATAWCPALRQGVVYQLGEGGAASLWDPIFRREVELGRVAAALVQRMDGRRDAGAVVDETAAALGLVREAAERSLRTLMLMNLVEGSGADIVARVQRLRAGYVPPPQALPETRFACQGSGDCCQNYGYGPLLASDRERLEALPLREAFPALGDGPLFEEREGPGGTEHYLRTDGDQCIFLLPDCRCGLHARFGAEQKPRLCQDFPLQYTPTLDGPRVYDRGECATFSLSSQGGPPLLADPARLLRFVPAGFDLAEELEHPVVLFDGQTPCDFGHYLRLQDALCARVEQSADAGTALRAMGELAADFGAALRRFPLGAGEPDGTLAALCAAPARGEAMPPEILTRGLRAIALLCGEVLRGAGLRIAAADRLAPLTSARNLRQLATVVHAAGLLAGEAERRLLGEAGAALPGPYLRIAAADATAPDVDGLLRRSLRQQAYGGRMLVEGRPLPALLRLGLSFVVSVVGARYSAAASARRRALPADLDHGHLLAMRGLRSQEALLLEHEASAFDVIAAAPLLACAAPGVEPEDWG